MAVLVFAVAAVLRLWHLDLKPLHHDEGVNGYFLLRLISEGKYVYDPGNYHGPTLFYLALIPAGYMKVLLREAEVSVTSIRLVPALCGLGIVYLSLRLKDITGRLAAGTAAVFIAVSPGAVFFSRYFIHETPLVFFTLASVVAALRYGRSGESRYLIATSIAAALAAATKETVVISAAVLTGAALCTFLLTQPARLTRRAAVLDGVLPGHLNLRAITLACILFLLVTTSLYSAFFMNPKGVTDAVRSLQFWSRTAQEAHTQPATAYLSWLWRGDAALLIAGAAGLVYTLRRPERFAVFVALWSTGIFAAYSLIPYKAPWLALNVIVPLSLLAGVAVSGAWSMSPTVWMRGSIAVTAAMLVCYSAIRCIELNYYAYDDDSQPYVYAQTSRGVLDLFHKMEMIANERGGAQQLRVAVMSPDYWPLPWYLRKYRSSYPRELVASLDDVVLISHKQVMRAAAVLGPDYEAMGTYPLRPGVDLILMVRTSHATSSP